MYKTIEETLEVYKKEAVKFWQGYLPLPKKEDAKYKDWKDLSIDMGKLITMQRILGLSRDEIGETMIETIRKALINKK